MSGISSDMRDVLNRTDSSEAREAITLYCRTARKHLAALTATVNGVDTIVFTGGIGEHAPTIRAGICAGLEYLGVDIAPERNACDDVIISEPDQSLSPRDDGCAPGAAPARSRTSAHRTVPIGDRRGCPLRTTAFRRSAGPPELGLDGLGCHFTACRVREAHRPLRVRPR